MIKTILHETLFEDIQNADEIFTKHFHDTYTIGITLDGKFKSYHLNKSYFSYKKSTKVINPYEVHGGESNSWDYLNFYPSIQIVSNIYEQIFATKKIPIFEKHIIDDAKLYELFYAFFYAIYHQADYIHIETSIIEALAYLVKNYTSHTKTKLFLSDKTIISNSIEYINDNLYTKISLQNLAELSQISKYHFLRIFKKHIGLTPHQYILNQKINNYKKELITNKHDIATYDNGFCDQSHLIRNFKKIYGYTPKHIDNSNFILYRK